MIEITHEFEYRNLHFGGCWHLAYYIPQNRGNGTLAGKIIQFKENNGGVVQKWCNWAATDLGDLEISFDYIVRALGSRELQASGTKACDVLGDFLADYLDAEYIPQVLSKHRATRPMHELKTYYERVNEMHGVYYVNESGDDYDLDDKNILILDDITTTSCTISEIKRALEEAWPEVNLHLFCIGRTSRNQSANDDIDMSYFE